MAKLTDRQKKQIIAEKVAGSSLRALGAKFGVSPTTIRRVLLNNPEFKQKVTQKKQENTASVLAFMESQKQDVCKVIDNLLNAINDPEKIAAAPLNQLATAMGIVIDKYTAGEAPKAADERQNNLLAAIEGWQEEAFDDLPEIQQAAAADPEMVEAAGLSG